MPVMDAPDSIQSQAASSKLHGDQRWSDIVDVYVGDAQRHYLINMGMLTQHQAVATRQAEESGSGRVRDLGVRPAT